MPARLRETQADHRIRRSRLCWFTASGERPHGSRRPGACVRDPRRSTGSGYARRANRPGSPCSWSGSCLHGHAAGDVGRATRIRAEPGPSGRCRRFASGSGRRWVSSSLRRYLAGIPLPAICRKQAAAGWPAGLGATSGTGCGGNVASGRQSPRNSRHGLIHRVVVRGCHGRRGLKPNAERRGQSRIVRSDRPQDGGERRRIPDMVWRSAWWPTGSSHRWSARSSVVWLLSDRVTRNPHGFRNSWQWLIGVGDQRWLRHTD